MKTIKARYQELFSRNMRHGAIALGSPNDVKEEEITGRIAWSITPGIHQTGVTFFNICYQMVNLYKFMKPFNKLAAFGILLWLFMVVDGVMVLGSPNDRNDGEEVSGLTTWSIVPGRSSIKFKVQHLLLFEVEGKFKNVYGKVITQNKDFSIVRIESHIPVNSIYTGNQDRDAHLLEEDFFYVDQFPEISFKSYSITKTGKQTFKIKGHLTIRGVTKPIELEAECSGKKVISNGMICANFTASGMLSRFDYGLKWNSFTEAGGALVGEMVEIILKIRLVKEDFNQ